MLLAGTFYGFFHLPAEIRCMVYREYFGSWTASVYYDETGDVFKLIGTPETAINLTCKCLRDETKSFLLDSFSGKLYLRDVRVHCKRSVGFRSSLEIVATMGINSILAQVHTITLENGTTGMLGLLPWEKLPRLKCIELEECLKVNPMAVGRISKYWPFDSKHDREGRPHIYGIIGYNDWTYVPSCVAEGDVRVVSVRRGCVSGACLKAVVEYKADRGELVERTCEVESGGWKWIVSSDEPQ